VASPVLGDDGAVTATAEFTIEPFVDGAPGPHVRAALAVAEEAGLDVEIGPFGTSVTGETSVVVATVDAVLRAAVDHGATRVSLQVTVEPFAD
jgi:uncharacterized protein YqgV (UPF0045/DUF77 family)